MPALSQGPTRRHAALPASAERDSLTSCSARMSSARRQAPSWSMCPRPPTQSGSCRLTQTTTWTSGTSATAARATGRATAVRCPALASIVPAQAPLCVCMQGCSSASVMGLQHACSCTSLAMAARATARAMALRCAGLASVWPPLLQQCQHDASTALPSYDMSAHPAASHPPGTALVVRGQCWGVQHQVFRVS